MLHELEMLSAAVAISIPIVIALVLRYIFQPALVATTLSTNDVVCEELKGRGVGMSKANHNNERKRSDSPSRRTLSIVIPAYNEEKRLPIMLKQTITFLNEKRFEISKIVHRLQYCDRYRISNNNDHSNSEPRHPIKQRAKDGRMSNITFEFMVVDDGSSDDTASVARDCFAAAASHARGATASDDDDVYRILQLRRNCGKGAAVKAGMLRSNADIILMADADGATDIDDFMKLLSTLINMAKIDESNNLSHRCVKNDNEIHFASSEYRPTVIIGSRAHLQESSTVKRSLLRTFLMRGFHLCVATLCSTAVKDTQCGFKLFTRSAALPLFTNLHLERWAFDTELIMLCTMLDISTAEVGVRWKEVHGSKLDTGSKLALLLVSIEMFRDMLCVRLCYMLGVWKIRH